MVAHHMLSKAACQVQPLTCTGIDIIRLPSHGKANAGGPSGLRSSSSSFRPSSVPSPNHILSGHADVDAHSTDNSSPAFPSTGSARRSDGARNRFDMAGFEPLRGLTNCPQPNDGRTLPLFLPISVQTIGKLWDEGARREGKRCYQRAASFTQGQAGSKLRSNGQKRISACNARSFHEGPLLAGSSTATASGFLTSVTKLAKTDLVGEVMSRCTSIKSDLAGAVEPEQSSLGVQGLCIALPSKAPKPVGEELPCCVSGDDVDPSAAKQQSEQKPRLTPPVSLLCNWGACDDVCIATLLDVLNELGWAKPKPKALQSPSTVASDDMAEASDESFRLFDLGSGDGCVLTEVVKRFPRCCATGVEINGSLVQAAKARARREGDHISKRCEFRQEDLAKTRDLSKADAIFMYLPADALRFVVRTVLPKANLQPGTPIFTADEPLPELPEQITRTRKSRQSHEARRLYWYVWTGATTDSSGKRDWIPPS